MNMKKMKKAIVLMTALVALLTILTANVFAAVENELAEDKAKNSLIPNGDFSNEEISDSFRGAFGLKPGEGIGGSNAVEVEQGSAVYYVMTDLKPNTAYTFVAYVKTLVMDGGDPPCIVIKGHGGDEIYSPTAKTEEYTRFEHSFMTGGEVKAEAEFHVWNVTAGLIMVDSMFLYQSGDSGQPGGVEIDAADVSRPNLIPNGDFTDENALEFNGGWTFSPGMGINGANALALENGNGIYKDIEGLKPNTDYTFVIYVKLSDGAPDPATLVVKEKSNNWAEMCWANSERQTGWQRVEWKYTSSADTSGQILELSAWNGSGAPALVDSIYLYTNDSAAGNENNNAAGSADTGAAADGAEVPAPQNPESVSQESPPAAVYTGNESVVLIIALALFAAACIAISARVRNKKQI